MERRTAKSSTGLPAAAFLLFLVGAFAPAAAQQAPLYDHPLFTGPAHEAPPHPYDQEHLRLALRFDPERKRMDGEATLRVRLLDDSLRAIVLFAAGLDVDSVFASVSGEPAKQAPFQLTGGDSLIVGLDSLFVPRPDSILVLPPDTAAALPLVDIRISYAAQPETGLYFVASPSAASRQQQQIWTLGAPEDNRHWFPAFQAPGDKLTSEVLVTVPAPMRVLSNGTLVEERTNADGSLTFHYRLDQPNAPYLIAFVAGTYEVTPASVTLPDGRRLPLSFWTYPDRANDALRTFGRTPEMMRFFSERLGVPFPWPAYAQVVIRQFQFGGMENTTMTTLNDFVLVDERATLDYDPDPLLAHELAHQWFGDFVTTAYWSDVWLNEGFATYLSALFTEHQQGEEAFALRLLEYEDRYLAEAAEYRRPIVWNRWEDPIFMFDAHSYQKGALVLHLLRRQIGDEAFWEALELYLKSHAFGSADTGDFQFALEAVTEQDFDAFFAQWLSAAGHPVLAMDYAYDPKAERLTLHLRQVQEGPLVPDVFRIQSSVEVHTLAGATRFEVRLDSREATYTFPLPMAPRFVLFDPDHALLAELQTEQPAQAWVAQLRYAPDAVSRLRAARALTRFKEDPALLIGLRSALESEEAPAVRAAVITTLGTLAPTPSVERALLEAYEHTDARVRTAVLDALGAYEGSAEVSRLAFQAAQRDLSYAVQAAAVRTLARTGAPNARDVVRSALVTPSHRDVIRQAALEALQVLDLPAKEALPIALEYSDRGQPSAVRAVAARYLQTLAGEDRNALNRLLDLLNDADYRVRQAAIAALAALQKPVAQSALQHRLEVEPQPVLRYALQRALTRHEGSAD